MTGAGSAPRGHVRYEQRDGAVWITLGEPERGNPVSASAVSQLLEAIRCAEADRSRVVVLRARGRHFSVGGDLNEFAAATDLRRHLDDLADSFHRVISELTRSGAVVVAVVQGPAAGAGCALAAAADIVLAAASSSFTFAYTGVGLSNDGGTSLLVHTLGLHRVLRLALLNDRLSAQEAADAGLVARVVADADLADAADRLVAALLAGSPAAHARVKRLLRDAAEPAPESVMRREALAIREAGEIDGREGVAAFLEKRPAEFRHAAQPVPPA